MRWGGVLDPLASLAWTIIALQRWHIPNFWMMNPKQAQFGGSRRHGVDQVAPRGRDGHIKARRLAKCQYLEPSRAANLLWVRYSWWLCARLQLHIHEISSFRSRYALTSKSVNRIQRDRWRTWYRLWVRGLKWRVGKLHRQNTSFGQTLTVVRSLEMCEYKY